ncbi:methionine synthase [Zavarzinia sp. CC-PAN008]|uniref:methionine synthase n=1 Tax=Zavarzinia sp. CC-PAN008 TaxID=3243332 RepID=UPI003F7466FA
MSDFLNQLKDRVLLCDGGMGALVQTMDLEVERDFDGSENCTEILNRTRPDIVRDIHRRYFAAGADMVETNSFGGSPITLGEFGREGEAYELNKLAAEIAREAAESFCDGRSRFVLGSVGPGTRLPSLGHVAYRPLEEALTVQARGLIDGGVDAILIETCQDPLQIKAAVNGAKAARLALGKDTPIMVQVTVETTGTLLVGADIAAAATIIDALDVPVMGLNCATGPQEMAEHVKWLSENWKGFISVLPNAGLPELVDGKTHYPLGPAELAAWLKRFVLEDGINLIGGCCGTNPDHIAALDAMLRGIEGANWRPRPRTRTFSWVPSIASLYGQVPLRQENAFLAIGERCNANGSKKFRDAQAAGDWETCVAMGREQVKEASHALDLCTAYVGRDEIADMTEVLSRMRGSVTAPIVIDSTELPVLEAALELYGGKPVINSINFEDGEEPAEKRLHLARKFGAAVVALTIDEVGMAKTVEDKVRIAHRLHDFACNRHGLPASDLMFDPLTFTICTGNEDDRKLGLWTLDAIERIAQELPECQIILGLSNISFGLNPAARHVLNSVFLDHALKRGMTGAIVHVSKITPLHKIPAEEVKIAEDLIFDRRSEGYDPLQAFIGLFMDRKTTSVAKVRAATVEERLKERIVDGDRIGLEAELDEALKTHKPLDIINTFLLDGMKVVGELFGAGKMQLPFVLQSAETMKAAVAHLEQFMEKIAGQEKGTIILATVKGDVHDIGKNLVDIILTNNGYRVVNLGIKQPVAAILDAAVEHKADAIGMSGLLVKSTVIMRENLEEMTRRGLDIPVFLGGAALTRKYVEEDCVAAYAGGGGRVAYARDAFDGLDLMARVVNDNFDTYLKEQQTKRAGRPSNSKKIGQASQASALRPVDAEETKARREELAKGVPVPQPPFWGARVIEHVPLKALVPFLNETMLFQFQWGFRKAGKDLAAYKDWARTEVQPILTRMLDLCARDEILKPQAVYGYWKAAAEGNEVVLFEEDGTTEAARLSFPRQARSGGLCIADFFRDVTAGERDVIGLQVVTMGQTASDVARSWFAENRYQDYLYLHGLGVEMAEALAEHTHKRIRGELGFSHEDAREMEAMLKQGYRGSRYSFGYPACPDLAQQRTLLKLLGAERVGIEMADEDQLHPEQSTSAIVVHHPQAKYFTV